jgi:hypothetical protein
MWRFLLAWKCFFLVLFARRLPKEAVDLLPPPELQPAPRLPPPSAEIIERAPAPPVAAAAVVDTSVDASADGASRGAILLLGLLQREGRLLDFLQEDIDSYADAQIGAAVRDIHRGCRKALADHLKVEPVLREPDEARVRIEPGFDPSRIRLVGNVVGQPPFTGTLKHPGWRGVEVHLPAVTAAQDPSVIAPAEVEL